MMTRSHKALAAGFTLIELMIVVVIATLLLSIAIPTYKSEILKSRRTDAKTALLDLAAREQRFFSVRNSFTTLLADLGYAPSGSTATSMTVGSGYYTVSVTTTATPGFTLTATTTGSQTADTSCQTFTVDNTGLQKAADSSGADNTATCWR